MRSASSRPQLPVYIYPARSVYTKLCVHLVMIGSAYIGSARGTEVGLYQKRSSAAMRWKRVLSMREPVRTCTDQLPWRCAVSIYIYIYIYIYQTLRQQLGCGLLPHDAVPLTSFARVSHPQPDCWLRGVALVSLSVLNSADSLYALLSPSGLEDRWVGVWYAGC